MNKAAVHSNLTIFSPDVAEVRGNVFPYMLGFGELSL
jgi:hypothetical protein